MLLDLQAARAVSRARLFERAVNDNGPWAVRIGEDLAWAVKVRTGSGVTFIAHFDHGVDVDMEIAWLLCHGEEVSSKEISPPDDHLAFALEWRITLGESQVESVGV